MGRPQHVGRCPGGGRGRGAPPHYGYWIYAAAVVARYDPTFVKAHDGHVLALIRDIANPSPADPYFTPWRHFDWCGARPDSLSQWAGSGRNEGRSHSCVSVLCFFVQVDEGQRKGNATLPLCSASGTWGMLGQAASTHCRRAVPCAHLPTPCLQADI